MFIRMPQYNTERYISRTFKCPSTLALLVLICQRIHLSLEQKTKEEEEHMRTERNEKYKENKNSLVQSLSINLIVLSASEDKVANAV
jgi:sensor domain CHASE-containing protein